MREKETLFATKVKITDLFISPMQTRKEDLTIFRLMPVIPDIVLRLY